MNKRPLSPKQKKYCRERIKGKTQRQAHKDAGYTPGASDKTHDELACRLEADDRIKAELERLQRLADAGAVLNREQRIRLLSEMAADDTRKDDSRQRAIDMLNKMGGDYSEKQIIEAKAEVSLSYEEKRQAVLDALRGEDQT